MPNATKKIAVENCWKGLIASEIRCLCFVSDNKSPARNAPIASESPILDAAPAESTIIEIDNVNIDYILDTILSSFWKACIETLFHSASSGK